VATGILRDEVCVPARDQVIFATAPFISAAIAWTVLGDPVEVLQIVGVVLAAAGLVCRFDPAANTSSAMLGSLVTTNKSTATTTTIVTTTTASTVDTASLGDTNRSSTPTPTSPISTTATTTDPPNVVMSGTSHTARNMWGGRPRLGIY